MGSIIGLEFDNPATDVSYRVMKIDNNFIGLPSFHVHWTKSGNGDESGNNIQLRLEYTVFNGNSDEVALVSPSVIEWTDTYEDSGTTSRIVYRTPNIAAEGFIANYYVGLALSVVPGGTTLTSNGVVVSADLIFQVDTEY